jgi:hypothetical protein
MSDYREHVILPIPKKPQLTSETNELLQVILLKLQAIETVLHEINQKVCEDLVMLKK